MKRRPLGLPTVEDRLRPAAVARVLGAIYEPVFRDSSVGFRPGRSAHDAWQRVRRVARSGRGPYVSEADLRSFCDQLDHAWRRRLRALNIGDPTIRRLIRQWLTAGIWDQDPVTRPEASTPRGPLSPRLAQGGLAVAPEKTRRLGTSRMGPQAVVPAGGRQSWFKLWA